MNAELKLGRALSGVGLPMNPAQVIRKNFLFQRSELRSIIGTVTGIELNGDDFVLLITPIEVWGGSLDHINYNREPHSWDKGPWMAEVKIGEGEYEDYSGNLKILEST